MYTFKHAYDHKLWGDAAFAAVNAVLAIYAILAFVGIWKSLCDLAANLASYLHKSDGSKSAPSRAPTPAEVSQTADVHDWEQVLHTAQQTADRRRGSRSACGLQTEDQR